MFAFLEQLSERERQGADRGAIRFGIAATGLTPAMRANLAEGMRAAWRNRGDPRLHGREVLFVAGDAPVFAQLFAHRHPASPWATDLPKGGEPIELFPLRGAVSGQRMRGLQPDDRAQIRALIEAAGTDAAIVAVDHMAMFLQAHRLAEKTTRSVPTGTGPLVLLGAKADLDRWLRLVPRERTVFLLFDDAVALWGDAEHRGRKIESVDPRATQGPRQPDQARLFAMAALLIDEALARAGRDLTRSGFLRALDTLRIEDEAWPRLDYARWRFTGTQATRPITLVIGNSGP